MAIDTSVLNLDFEVLGGHTNCKALMIADLSNWGPAFMNPSYIDITTPGSTIPISTVYQKNIINRFNVSNLNMSDVTDYSSLGPLPDGAYQICVRVCMGTDSNDEPIYESICKYHLQDCMLRCRINKKILAIDLTCSVCRTSYLEQILEVQLFLDAAQAQIQNCNVNKAMEYYRRATMLLDNLQEPDQNKNKFRRTDDCPECWPGNRGY